MGFAQGEEKMATIIEKVVEMWDKNYSHKTGMRETFLRIPEDKEEKILGKDRKILSTKGKRFDSKITFAELPTSKIYYYFRLTEIEFTIKLRFKFSKFPLLAKSKSLPKEIDGIPLDSAGNQQLALKENFIDKDPTYICNCMEKFIRKTQAEVYEFYKKQYKPSKPEECLREKVINLNKKGTFLPEYEVEAVELGIEKKKLESGKEKGRRIDLLLKNKKDKSLLVVEFKAKRADCGALKQILGYLTSKYLNLLNDKYSQRKIKGCIVAPEIGEDLKAEYNGNIMLYPIK